MKAEQRTTNNQQPTIAVVILNYNGKHWLEKFLPSVIQNSGAAKIIVADNHSTDDSVSFLEEKFPSVHCINIPSNLGFCGGYNFALKQVSEKYYVLLNSDVEVTPNWIELVIELFESDPSVAAIQPKILSYHHKNLFEYAGAGGGFIDALGYPFCRGRIFTEVEEDKGQYDDVVPVFWATGACLFIRAELYHQMGGLDEDFFAHMEEIDLCWRLQRAGHQVYYHGQSKIYHVGGGTLSTSNPRKTYYNFKNGLSLIFKNLPSGQLIYKLPFRILLDWVAAVKFLSGGSVKDFFAVGRAHLDFMKGITKDLKKRKQFSTLYGYGNEQTLPGYKGLLVADYFLFKKRTYRDLR